MPVSWIPKIRTIQEDIAEEEARLEALKPPRREMEWQPEIAPEIEAPPTIEPELGEWMPRMQTPALPAPTMPQLALPPVTPKPKEAPIELPFWKRALQVFTAPFVWMEEYVIRPGLSLTGTALGFVPEVVRQPGEDYWEWKRRSWGAWKAPGIDMDVPWSDDPWRIDLKGVMELAPWLLIPGAGQVGGVLRAGRGIAGMLGRLGPAGRLVGTAVEYSPWGLVEKTAGVALRRTFKGLSAVLAKTQAKVGERVFGKIPEPAPPSPVVVELTNFMKETVIPARKEFEKLGLPALRARQAASLEKIEAKYRRGEITAIERTRLEDKALGVAERYTKAGYAVKTGQFTKDKVDELLEPIYKAAEGNFEAKDAARALVRLLLKGEIPEPRHFIQFAQAYGDDFAKAVGKFARSPRTLREKVLDLLNLPRAVLASCDLSATFRQGLILLLAGPKTAPRAFARQLKAFASEKLALEMDDVLRSRPLFQNAVRDGVEFTAIRRGAAMAVKEEPFFSNLAQSLPMVRRSERAFTVFLNEMRMSAYEAAYGAMTAQGAGAAEMKLMARFINVGSGRGVLPANLNRYAPMLNTVLFSARYQMSTLQLPRQIGRMLLSKNPYMRKEAAKALVAFLGGGSAILGLFKVTGRGKVELDPRSGDFGKIIIGDTRLDIWRGYVQYARFVAQVLAGERKSAYGNLNKVQRYDIAFRFLQSKASPAMGMFVDLLKGENYMGETLFEGTKGISKTVRDRVFPLALQDVMDAMEQSGIGGLWTAAPATMGFGVLTYVNDYVRAKEKIARRMGYESWDDIDPKTQRMIQNTNAELQVATIEWERQIMGTAWGDWRLAGNAIEDIFKENVEVATTQYRQTNDGYTFRQKVSDAFTARRGGYDARSKEPQFEDIVRRLETEDTAEALVGLGPEQMAIRIYNDALWGDDMYDEFGDYRFDEAEIRKEQLHRQLGEEMFNYVEEYRGMKYETFPPEYQELARAKIVLRPYWEVQEKAERLFGKPKTEWQQRRIDRVVSRMRKQMRRQNPEMEKAYIQFYTRG